MKMDPPPYLETHGITDREFRTMLVLLAGAALVCVGLLAGVVWWLWA